MSNTYPEWNTDYEASVGLARDGSVMGPDDFHDLTLCPDCKRDMTAGKLHTADCPLALAQDAEDDPHQEAAG
jgi:hypothetical protein